MENLDEMRRYVFKKEYVGKTGNIIEGSEITRVHGCLYFNGGLMDPSIVPFFESFIRNPKLKNEYLVETRIMENKL